MMSNSMCLDTLSASKVNRIANVDASPPLAGVYSNTGFDMINVLSRLINRPNPQIQLGPIDLSCSFVVSDANQFDCPVIYCSPAFERLTGYSNAEIVGKNCRFLQSPDGQVTCGSRRQHTDNQAVYHLKDHLNQKKELQASIINYRKGGQPFVNLVTVIPILNDNGQVDYFVGLQVDLVEQPNSILEKMKDGTYMINYHQNASVVPTDFSNIGSNPLVAPNHSSMDDYFREIPSTSTTTDIINLLDAARIDHDDPAFNEQQIQKEWNQLLLDQTCDFIHVLSLKGVFMYASKSSLSMLEYEPSELLGNSLSSVCHPSDIVPVMREIKEATSDPDKMVNLLFRIRKKNSGYAWIDCCGKLHMDQNKSRKCLVLSGRERPVYQLSQSQILQHQLGEEGQSDEYWAKLSLGGLYLHVTHTCKDVVGFTSDSLEQESIYQYLENDSITEITNALDVVKEGRGIPSVTHTILNSKGSYIPVTSTFYSGDNSSQPSFILLQIKLLPASVYSGQILPHISIATRIESDNLFAELDSSRTTNWQYELHQLQQSNKRLRDQLEMYNNPSRQKRKNKSKSSEYEGPKICAICQRTDSPEWRRGPNGPKELCNACGLRYAKSLIRK
ncbi:putative white-collar-1c protein [Parasitella parasitica]|nr:putative white-collar-1c protein [Parasitella parasitica]